MFTRRQTLATLAGTASAAALGLPALAAGAKELKIGHGHTESHSFHMAMEQFSALLEEKAPGAFNVSLYANSQLGNEREMQEQLTFGTLEMTVTGVLGIYEPMLALLELPFLFPDRDAVRKAHDSEAVAGLVSTLPGKGLRLIGFVENGFRNITNNVKPIMTPADVAGLKIRTPENPAQIETFKALGAQPTPMPFSELYAALKQGVVDGQENPLQNIYDGKLHEVQKHLALTGHIYNSAYTVISESFYAGLEPELQAAVTAAATEAGNWQMDMLANKDAELLATLKEAGIEVTEPDKAAFLEATAPAYDIFYAKYGDDAKTFVAAMKEL
ncbi:TRAP transporter substrate-binding protein [Pseudooceanicola sp. C21-150M6]|uniref:TRAP transporter substrate-binding protein n=1 Tax=Pseudooceanicola sp. C21-150M6 TaxID=3434355 RepID=UPI003D7F23F6